MFLRIGGPRSAPRHVRRKALLDKGFRFRRPPG